MYFKTYSALIALCALPMAVASIASLSWGQMPIQTTTQIPVEDLDFPNRYHRVATSEKWNPQEVAIIVCDVWDSHHCVNAVRRVHELAPRIDALTKLLRSHGATIIHAPSDCMAFYEKHPARNRARAVPTAENLPQDLNRWCDKIPSEEGALYPVDQSDGGEDDDLTEHAQWAKTLAAEGRNPRLPWRQQIPDIEIDSERDFVTDSGSEVWNILEAKRIQHVLICGVHTNMCVLGRPFGLRQLTSHGKHAVLIRDLTDTMYNPARWPCVNHFSGTDLVIDHIEQFVCATTTSDWLFRWSSSPMDPTLLKPHRFSTDRRPHLAILIAEDEYRTANTLPSFAAAQLRAKMQVSLVYSSTAAQNSIVGLNALDEADALLVSVRRRPLKADDLDRIQRFVKSGKPVIGIRTASHAFCLRDGKTTQGTVQWPEFDAYAFGGNYTNHHGNELIASIVSAADGKPWMESRGSLYKTSPLAPGTRVLLQGKVEGQPEEPVAWTFVRPDGGHSFYTSLGHPSDFERAPFRTLLANAVFDACGLPAVDEATVRLQDEAYTQGQGKQR